MDDYKDAIAACCKQLRLSVNLVENAMIQTGGSHQEYLYHLLRDEMQFTVLSGRHSVLERPLSAAKRPLILTDCR